MNYVSPLELAQMAATIAAGFAARANFSTAFTSKNIATDAVAIAREIVLQCAPPVDNTMRLPPRQPDGWIPNNTRTLP